MSSPRSFGGGAGGLARRLAAPPAAPAQLFLNDPRLPGGADRGQRPAGRPADAGRDPGRISRPSDLEPALGPQRRGAAMPVLALSADGRQLQRAPRPPFARARRRLYRRSKAISAGSTAAPGRASSTSIRPRPTTISRRCRRSSASARPRRGSARRRSPRRKGELGQLAHGADARAAQQPDAGAMTAIAFTAAIR